MNHLFQLPFKKTAKRSSGLQGGQLRLEFKRWWRGGTAISQALQLLPTITTILTLLKVLTSIAKPSVCPSVRLSVILERKRKMKIKKKTATMKKPNDDYNLLDNSKRRAISSKLLRVNIDQFQWWNHLPEHKAICKKSDGERMARAVMALQRAEREREREREEGIGSMHHFREWLKN